MNPQRAEGSYITFQWGVAWWAEAAQQWILDSELKPSQLQAEAHKTWLLSMDSDIPHKVVRVSSEVNFKEI